MSIIIKALTFTIMIVIIAHILERGFLQQTASDITMPPLHVGERYLAQD